MKTGTAVFLLLSALTLGGCTRLSDRGFDRATFAEDVDQGATIRLADHTSFEWNRVHIFGPYTRPEEIAKEVGSRVPFPHADSEGHCLLVFMSGSKVSAAFEVERKFADFADLFRKGGHSREEAVLAVEVGSGGWKRLVKKEANKALE